MASQGSSGGKPKRRRQGNLVYGTFRSRPGEPPRKQTGRLHASVAIEQDLAAVSVKVGTNVVYGRYLELGTRYMAARPWLRRAMLEQQTKITAMINRPMRIQDVG